MKRKTGWMARTGWLWMTINGWLVWPGAVTICPRQPLPPASGTILTAGSLAELKTALAAANASGGTTILLEDGTYLLDSFLYITGHRITIRSRSGNRGAVVLAGPGMTGAVPHVFLVRGRQFTLADMTIGRVANHGIQVQGEQDADGLHVHNVRFIDTGEQMLKGSFATGNPAGADDGVVEWCSFEYTAGTGPQYYIGGIDVHQGRRWLVRYNEFKGIRSPEEALAEHAIHFWSWSEDTVVEGNVIVDCDRGVGFGLGSSGHRRGVIRNNFVYTTRDVGIGLENSEQTSVLHNTVFTLNYFASIEYRFTGTAGGRIMNNLTNESIMARNGGTADLAGNMETAEAGWFTAPLEGDLHLAGSPAEAEDAGVPLPDVTGDIDCQGRPAGTRPDAGADEVWPPGLPGDLNEDGGVTVLDACILLQYLAGHCLPGEFPFTAWLPAADWNADGQIDAADLHGLAGWLAGSQP